MSTSPYPGLRPFHRDEADIFFGRDEQVDQLLIRLGKSRFLAVVGPSGCGKSSLVHTGLLNALDAGLLAGAGLHWRLATMQPGSHPMRNLANALVNHIGMDSNPQPTDANTLPDGTAPNLAKGEDTPQSHHTALLLASLRRGPLGLLEILREQPLPTNTNLLLVVDQFEEIFRYREHQDRDEADAFVSLLLRSLEDSEFPIYIVITMRSDFLGDCALFSGLPETLNDSQYLTPRLTREQRRLAITGPAKVCGGEIEPALVNRLLNDMGADPDQLPILQHALMRLWTDACKRDDKPIILKLSEYEALGGWENALSNHADEALAELDQHQQVLAETLFRALSERSSAKRDTRRPVTLQTVADIAGISMDKLIPVIEVFRHADRSFILPSQGQPLTEGTLLDISHESLIRQWQRMKTWVEQEAQSAETYRRLEQSALLYSQKRGRLLQGLDLFPVLDWRKREKPNAAWATRYGNDYERVKRFLEASEFWHKIKSVGKVLGFLLVCITAIWMAWLWQEADTERHKAASAQLLAEGELIRSQDPSKYPLSALFGIEAMKQHLLTHNALNRFLPDIWDIEPEDPRFMLNQFLRDSLGMLPKPGHLLQHDAPVNKIIYSPNGQLLATVSDDNTARLWEIASGKELQRLSHEDDVVAVVFSPDGQRLATASKDKTARLWDTSSGNELQRLSHEDYVTAVSFSPDGHRLATASYDKTARLWDLSRGEELKRLNHEGEVNTVSFSPDGQHLATASRDKAARLWDTASGKELQRLSHDNYVNVAIFSPNGQRLATASGDNTARLWDTASGKELQRLKHDNAVHTAVFSSDGLQIATVSSDNTARLWRVSNGEELERLSHESGVIAVGFSPDGLSLSTASFDSTARLWDISNGKELKRLYHEGDVSAVSFSPDGQRLATASGDNTARLWEVSSNGQELQRLNHEGGVAAVSFSPDGKRLATASEDNTAHLWDTASGKELQRLSHEREISVAVFSPNGQYLATTSKDDTARLWNVSNGKELQRIKHEGNVVAVSFSPDGQYLATASHDKTARLWEVSNGKELQRLSHDGHVMSVSFNPNGQLLATASTDSTARLWDTTSGKELQRLKHDSVVYAASLSPDGKLLATASMDNTARLWDVASGNELQRLVNDSYVYFVSFSPDGKRLATASNDKTTRLWDTSSGKELRRLIHDSYIYAISFSPDGERLATASYDKTARLWDTYSGKELQRLNHDDGISAVSFSPDGQRLATASWDKTARLWLWRPDDLIEQLCPRMLSNFTWHEWQQHFENIPYRKTCNHLPVASDYQEQGKDYIRKSNNDGAIRMIRQLNAADPKLALDQDLLILRWTAPLRLRDAQILLNEKKLPEAIAAFNQADQMDNTLVSGQSWNELCWYGSLAGFSSKVFSACEKAVNAATPEKRWFYQDSRGIARALIGNNKGAIEDFEAFIHKSGDENLKKQRQAWINALRAGQNPFTKEELATLQGQ